MRLLTRRLARAFPELDRFDDAQADAFCRSAARQLWPSVLRWATVTVCGVMTLAAGVAAAGLTQMALAPSRANLRNLDLALSVLAMIIVLATGFVLTMLTRDWLLRRRVRVVIRLRGTCPRCRYVLLGQPVGDDLRVSCPECGLTITADPALRELATDAQGRSVYQPEAPELDPAVLARRARRRRRLKTAAIWIPTCVIGLLLLAAIIAWMLIHAQARRAQTIMAATPGQVVALIDRVQPKDTTERDNQWPAIIAILDKFVAQTTMGPPSTPDERAAGATLDFASIAYERSPSDFAQYNAEAAATRSYSRRVFEAIRNAPVIDELRVIERIPHVRFTRPWVDPGPASMSLGLSSARSGFTQARSLARFNVARMHQAVVDKDRETFERALSQSLALADGLRRQPSIIDTLVAVAIEATVLGIIERDAAALADLGWLDAAQARLSPMLTPVSSDRLTLPFEAARLESTDAVARFFADPGRVMRVLTMQEGLPSQIPGVTGTMPTAPWNVGTLDSNTGPLDAACRKAAELMPMLPANRPANWMNSAWPMRGFAVGATIAEPWPNVLRSVEQIRLMLRGVYTLTAIERFRVRTGSLPRSLDDLTAADGVADPSLLIDPYSGKALVYKIAKGDLEWNRFSGHPMRIATTGYRLYSVGLDGIDNGGLLSVNPFESLQPAGAGKDYLFGLGNP